jgi:hypothetical protein
VIQTIRRRSKASFSGHIDFLSLYQCVKMTVKQRSLS